MDSPRTARIGVYAAGLSLAACTTPNPLPLDAFESTLDANVSATEALTQWCRTHNMGNPPVIRAVQMASDAGDQPSDLRDLLRLNEGDTIGYRHVRLVCGETVLSEAHNWYVPARLSPEMNGILESTDTPFGKAVAALDFTRRKLASVRGGGAGCPADTILMQRAVLSLPDGTPISLVQECYTRANLTPDW
ncbi:hypothetical protein NT2_12_00090 [Caenibius tardaugens NBRC 16725]|uniref:Chorismate lyase n=1 Tax=Caenibius tardaugens NBRC 16725 TaxID=1219035 RepID=U2YPA3_9SPHN|nr:hypothetical protein [Caenibius tardaugens]AZI36441.1 hypothetical protein EGO55_11170 [Caenibius tardaugens NBRC 16725]GAD50745.1 hypothetical protein NT2_12_00090 [Caenibius tardaugens NBRC 16725]